MPTGWCRGALLVLLLAYPAGFAAAAEDFTFDAAAFAPKPLSWGGYLETKGEYLDLNRDGAFYTLRHYRQPRAALYRLSPALQVEGTYRQGIAVLRGKARLTGAWDQLEQQDRVELLAGQLSLTPSPRLSLDLGKKVYRWGTGYAFNPVGFVERPKDPDNPEDSREGYLTAGLELTTSGAGRLRTASLSLVTLPVAQGINEDFGAADHYNLAAKLYLLYRDTDISLLGFTGDSRSTRFGVAMARNLWPHLAIHGELAHIPSQSYRMLAVDGSTVTGTAASTSYLLGLRYLTAQQLTIITEFYHNDGGYRPDEGRRFQRLVATGHRQYQDTGTTATLERAAALASRYGRPQGGRDYLYTRLSWKEPADTLYFTPAFTVIANLDDHSASLSPELTYTGFADWEARLRFTLLTGGGGSEYGEKANRHRLELRLRRFF
ncbi:MAG: hypothetical protein U5J62_06790 [Desulfurivibrio sp.]|nr:hypothetical protein [Desulfurivibrio sp.]